MGKDGISFQPKMSTNKQIKVRTQVLCKDLRYYVPWIAFVKANIGKARYIFVFCHQS